MKACHQKCCLFPLLWYDRIWYI